MEKRGEKNGAIEIKLVIAKSQISDEDKLGNTENMDSKMKTKRITQPHNYWWEIIHLILHYL